MLPSQLKKNINNIFVKPPKYGFIKDKETGEKVPKTFAQTVIKVGGPILKLKLTGDLFMAPSRKEGEEWGLQYSMGVEFNESDCEIFDAVLDRMDAVIDDNEYERKEVHEDGKIFFKLKTNSNQTEFKHTSNIPLKPNKLLNDKIDVGMEVTVELLATGWYLNDPTTEQKKYGIGLKIKSIHFGPQVVARPATKRRKVEEEEVIFLIKLIRDLALD